LQARLYVDYVMSHETKKDAEAKNQQAKMKRVKNWRRADG